MESKDDVRERLTSMVSDVSLPTHRKAAIWANIEGEIQKFEQQSARKRRRTGFFRWGFVGVAAACVAVGVTMVLAEQSVTPVQKPGPAVVNPGASAVVMQFQGQAGPWAGVLSQISQHQRETDKLDLIYHGSGNVNGETIACDVETANGTTTETSKVTDGKVEFTLLQPVQPNEGAFKDIQSVTYTIRLQWQNENLPLQLHYATAYTTTK